MTREEANMTIDYLKEMQEGYIEGEGYEQHPLPEWYVLDKAIEALEQEPCEDCISRQEVLDQTYLWSKDEFLRVTNPFDYLRKRINSLPPVTPQPKMGHWIDDKCSVCGKGTEDFISSREWYRNEEPNFCPFCGIKLVDLPESEDKE